jgi:hypothetical protein
MRELCSVALCELTSRLNKQHTDSFRRIHTVTSIQHTFNSSTEAFVNIQTAEEHIRHAHIQLCILCYHASYY